MKNWIGKAIAFIGVIHTTLGLVIFRKILQDLFSEGLFNTVNGQMDREFFYWFTMFGVVLIIFGALVNWIEQTTGELPNWLGWTCFIFTVVLLIIMPISGAWLLLIPAIGAIIRRRRQSKVGMA